MGAHSSVLEQQDDQGKIERKQVETPSWLVLEVS